MFIALLDTCVLWPSLQRDFLLSLSFEVIYRATWGSRILQELEYCETQKLIKKFGYQQTKAQTQARRLIRIMRESFADGEITGWEGLAGSYELPDPNDKHVVASAVVAGAGVIVTENLKDFPREKIPHGIEITTARQFAVETVALAPLKALRAVEMIAARSGNQGQQRKVTEILTVLSNRYSMQEAAAIIQDLRQEPSESRH